MSPHPVLLKALLIVAVLVTTLIPTPAASAVSETSARQLPGQDFTTSATTPGTVQQGQLVAITARVKSRANATVLVDIEVFDATGRRVHQRLFDHQAFAAGQERTFATSWQAPSSARLGTYTVKVGIFSPGWAATLAWNDAAGQFTVQRPGAASPTST